MKQKQFLIPLVIVLLTVGVFFFLKNRDVKTVQVTTTDTKSGSVKVVDKPKIKPFTKEDFYDIKVTDVYKEETIDLGLFSDMFKGDSPLFEKRNESEKDFYKVWRSYLYGEKFPGYDVAPLEKCLDNGSKDASLTGTDLQICEGKDAYENKENFGHIKDMLMNFKLVSQGKQKCEYFLEKQYDFPANLAVVTKINDYLSCRMIRNKNYDYYTNYFRMKDAAKMKNCDFLNDKGLQLLCSEVVGKKF